MSGDLSTEIPTISSAIDLLQVVELTGLRTFEITGRRVDQRGIDDADGANMGIAIMESHDTSQIETRFRATVEADEADFVVEVGLLYKLDSPANFTPGAIREFLEKVAVMAAYPFLREAIATTAARMELPVPVLGLLRQGGVQISVSDEAI